MNGRDEAQTVGLIPVDDLDRELVICALANAMRDDPKGIWNRPGVDRRVFTVEDLRIRLGCAERSSELRSRYSSGGALLRNPRFLSDIGVPVTFVEHPELGCCLKADGFDAVHGKSTAASAISYLRATGSSDTRTCTISAPSTEKGTAMELRQMYSDPILLSTRGEASVFELEGISKRNALGLLYHLLVARCEGESVDPQNLEPAFPARCFRDRPPVFCIAEVAAENMQAAINDIFGEHRRNDPAKGERLVVSVELLTNGFIVHGLPREMAVDLVHAGNAYAARGWRVVERTISGVSGAATLVLSVILGAFFLGVDLIASWSADSFVVATEGALAGSEGLFEMLCSGWFASLVAPAISAYRYCIRRTAPE